MAACTLPSSSRFFRQICCTPTTILDLWFSFLVVVLEAIQSSVGFSSESFDYDLVLKATAQAERVERIDKVLYHVQNAASISPDADRISSRREEEAFRTGRKVLANHLRRNGIVRWFLPMFPIVSIPFVIECPMRRHSIGGCACW